MNDWQRRGFAEPPRRVVAAGTELLYRVGGGPKSLALGAYFSPLKVETVSAAEQNFNIVEWGNRCYYLATYRVRPGTVLWVGRIAAGARDLWRGAALQVYIDQPEFGVELVKDVEALRQDLFVSPRAGHA